MYPPPVHVHLYTSLFTYDMFTSHWVTVKPSQYCDSRHQNMQIKPNSI